MKGKSSLREEGHGVRGEIKGAIFPPRRESSAGASPNLGEGLLRGAGGAAEGAMLGARAGGGCWAPGSPWSHTAVREGSGCKEVKSLASTPKPSHPLCHPEGNITVGEAAPPQLRLRRPVGHRGPWDAEGDGYGKPYSPLGLGEGGCSPRRRGWLPLSICGEPSLVMEGDRTMQVIAPNLPFPSSASIHAGCFFLLNNGPW